MDKQRREQILKDDVPPVQKEIHCFFNCVDKGVLIQPMSSEEDGRAVNAIVEQGIRSVKP